MKILVSLLMSVMFLGGQAAANEVNSCVGEEGAAYGLCTAYCVALECEGADPIGSDEACARVSAQYSRITGESPPCTIQCPTWTPAELQEAYDSVQCCETNLNDYVQQNDDWFSLYDNCQRSLSDPKGTTILGVITHLDPNTGEVVRYSGQFIMNWRSTQYYDRWIELTKQEHAACTRDILNHTFSLCQ